VNLGLLGPELALAGAAGALLVLEAAARGGLGRTAAVTVAFVGLLAAAMLTIPLFNGGGSTFSGAIVADSFSAYLKLLLAAATALVLLASGRFLDALPRHRTESIALLLLATAGLMVLVSANDLITLYVALELGSLATIFLAAWAKGDTRSTEAGMKFFLLNALSSAVLLYGFAILYGLSGQTRLDAIAGTIGTQASPAALLALALVVTGLGFKVSAVPFQMWTPDVYEGAPTPITAYLSVASKAAAFAALARVLYSALPGITPEWTVIVSLVAALTMTLGNLVALTQTNIKRMLAYSSIAQAGYVLVGIAAGSDRGLAAVLFYLAAYTATNLGAFLAVIEIAGRLRSERIADLAGLHQRAPGLAFALAVSLLSLAGLPPLAGFFAKVFVFWAAIESGLGWLVLAGVLNSALSLYYYVQVIHEMYIAPPAGEPGGRAWTPIGASVGIAVAGTLILGVFSGYFMGFASTAANVLSR
jgi:NADH-quinone oxidoreductase subunit N